MNEPFKHERSSSQSENSRTCACLASPTLSGILKSPTFLLLLAKYFNDYKQTYSDLRKFRSNTGDPIYEEERSMVYVWNKSSESVCSSRIMNMTYKVNAFGIYKLLKFLSLHGWWWSMPRVYRTYQAQYTPFSLHTLRTFNIIHQRHNNNVSTVIIINL